VKTKIATTIKQFFGFQVMGKFASSIFLGCCASAPNLAFSFCTPTFDGNWAHALSFASSVSLLDMQRIPTQARKHKLSAHCLFHSSSSSSSAADHVGFVESIIMGPELPPIHQSAKRLFLVRHGEVVNPGGDRPVYYGAMDVPLSPLGEAEASAAAYYLKSREDEIDLVVSSPLSRATFGANEVLKILSSVKELSVITMDGFKELDRGSWCGKTKDEIGPERMARFDACDASATPEGGESYPSLKRRVLDARDAVLKTLSCRRAAVIVSHLQVTRSILSEALDIPIEEMAGLKVATASVTCIDYDIASGTETVHFQSFKPDVGLDRSGDGAN
jgi:2,3-bisphosphoglycerate-dependent phosphoglycerate mutase